MRCHVESSFLVLSKALILNVPYITSIFLQALRPDCRTVMPHPFKAEEFAADRLIVINFQTCLVIFRIKGDDEDDDTDANPTEGDD